MALFLDSAPSGGGKLAASQPASVSHTGDTNETTLATFIIGAGHGLTTGSKIHIDTMWTFTSNANAKTIKVKIGSTSFSSYSLPSLTIAQIDRIIVLRSLSSQVTWASNSSTTYGTSNGGVVTTASEDLSGAFTITITATCGTGTDTMTLEYATVKFEIV